MNFNKQSYQSLQHLQKICLKQNIAFASYRLPLQTEITTLVQHQSMPERLNTLVDLDQKVGFIISPFIESDKHKTYLLSPDCVFLSNEIEDDFIQNLSENNRFLSLKKTDTNLETTASNDYIEQVNKAILAMKKGEFNKVVLSKIRLEMLPDSFEPDTFFLKLCEKYPSAFVYLIQLPEVGTWMGATPEPLVNIENERVKTVSLAGTQLASNTNIDSYGWSDKEIEEQEIVTDFVEHTLHGLQINNYSKVGPLNYQAANLIHLKTEFEFAQADLKTRVGDFIKALHPTPSVGGLPKSEAIDFILDNEKHDRSYYSGFLGPINIDKKSNVFVNLRCLKLFDKKFVLYSGAGITSSSVAEKEWEETDNKMLTLMNVMKTP